MIRIVSKDEPAAEHASELVGRYVGKEGGMRFRSYTRPMLVTEYSGSRLYVKVSRIDNGSLGKDAPSLLPVEEWDQEEYIQAKSVAYVCDTIEECESMMLASRKAMRIWQEAEAQIKRDVDQVFADLSHDPAALPQP